MASIETPTFAEMVEASDNISGCGACGELFEITQEVFDLRVMKNGEWFYTHPSKLCPESPMELGDVLAWHKEQVEECQASGETDQELFHQAMVDAIEYTVFRIREIYNQDGEGATDGECSEEIDYYLDTLGFAPQKEYEVKTTFTRVYEYSGIIKANDYKQAREIALAMDGDTEGVEATDYDTEVKIITCKEVEK